MSTRCQIEFRSGNMRRTVYRHWDGYPSAVIEDLLAFLAWSVRGSDIEYVAANFLYWSKREITKRFPRHEQLGFGICGNDELPGRHRVLLRRRVAQLDVRITARAMEHDAGGVRLGRIVRSAVYTPPARKEETPLRTPFQLCCYYRSDGWCARAAEGAAQMVSGTLRDDQLREFRRCDNPHERITFEELLDAA